MRKSPAGIALSKQISDYIRVLDPSVAGTKRAVTSAYPGVGEDKMTDDYLAPLDVAGCDTLHSAVSARSCSLFLDRTFRLQVQLLTTAVHRGPEAAAVPRDRGN